VTLIPNFMSHHSFSFAQHMASNQQKLFHLYKRYYLLSTFFKHHFCEGFARQAFQLYIWIDPLIYIFIMQNQRHSVINETDSFPELSCQDQRDRETVFDLVQTKEPYHRGVFRLYHIFIAFEFFPSFPIICYHSKY